MTAPRTAAVEVLPVIRSNAARALGLAVAAALAGGAGPAAAHGPDPLLGTTPWGQNQLVQYMWTPGQVPPVWASSNIDRGAADSNATRASKSAVFARSDAAASRIAYGGTNPCPAYGIACMNRSGVPISFGVWFKPHGTVLDWGTLRWCQAQSTPTNGCYDIRRVALDELGHVEMLNHHVNYDDESDYLDAVVQYAGRSRPKEGWDTHVYGRCDVAQLQLQYELLDAGDPVSSCLSLATTLTIAVDPSSVSSGSSSRVTGELEITATTAAKRMAGDPLSRRTITLQRRDIGATTWVTIATMGWVSGSDGSYVTTIKPTGTADYRLFFDASPYEGLRDSTSPVVRIEVGVILCRAPALAPRGHRTVAPSIACL